MTEKIKKILTNFRLNNELEDFQSVHEEINKSIDFKGTNLWILIFAIFIASVGLNMNSTAVIIGAMLISPLMGPINGMGYGIATYDFSIFNRSISNFTIAIIVSLLTSALYFAVSPVDTAHSELLARTSPTIYDVFIALFGGVAGMLAMSSKLKGNVIPGVAIATALMPPLCTAGYGLATLQFSYFFGAFYLFTINTFFIGIGTMLVSQVLKFPIRMNLEEKRKRKINRYITAMIIAITVPSIFFGYQLVQKEKFLANYKKFIAEVSVRENNYLLKNVVNENTRQIHLIYSGYGLKEETLKDIKDIALGFSLDTAKLKINSGTDADILHLQTAKMQSETEKLNTQLNANIFALEKSKETIDSLRQIPTTGENLLKEIKQIYPQIQSIGYAETYFYPDTVLTPLLYISSQRNSITNRDKNKIEEWAKARLNKKSIKIVID